MDQRSRLGRPLDVRPLFPRWHEAFLRLLRGLAADDWSRPTACPGWSVQDVAAHVLGDHAGRLSIHRDGHQAEHPGEGEPFPSFIDRINAEWVTAMRRVSPPLLVDLLDSTGTQVAAHWQAADLDALTWPVSWAGDGPAPVWLDAARDFTEYWTHHQQIAEATGRPGLTGAPYMGTVLDTFMRGLPHTLREVDGPDGLSLAFRVTGEGAWTCLREGGAWVLSHGPPPSPPAEPAAYVELDADTTWRLCTRGITPEEAGRNAVTGGDRRLTGTALTLLSIIRAG
jgi:uncharacterized protein (TIGR03083 family)